MKISEYPPPPPIGGYVFGHVLAIFLSCFICCIFQLPTIGGITKKRRQYNPQLIAAAYRDVTEKGVSVYKAARMYGIPESTLRDRTLGIQPVVVNTEDMPRPGPAATFSRDEEIQLVDHLAYMANIGYGYSRQEFLALATDFAISLGKKTDSDPIFAASWYTGFKSRHPDVTLAKPQKLSLVRAKCTSKEVLDRYFDELGSVISTSNLDDKPSNIWNIDETGIVMEHSPSNVLCLKGYTPQAITSNRGKNVTIIAAGNAAGTRIPPYYVFPGKRWNDDLMTDSCPGSSGYMTESGWSNSNVFMDYLEQHFKKHVPSSDTTNLVIFDGHRSHINLTLKEWGISNNVVFFVLPPHTSHVTQPLDVGCFGPLKNAYYSECQAFLRRNPGMQITRYNVAGISGRAYNKGLTPENLISSFRKTGIYPVRKQMIDEIKTAPSIIYSDQETSSFKSNTETSSFLNSKKVVKVKSSDAKRKAPPVIKGNIMSPSKEPLMKKIAIQKDESKPIKVKKTAKFVREMKLTKSPGKPNISSPRPSTSGIQKCLATEDSQDSDYSEADGGELCCVCRKYQPDDLNLIYILEIVSWGQCSRCDHWTHLKFCSKVRCMRRGSVFLCPHCE